MIGEITDRCKVANFPCCVSFILSLENIAKWIVFLAEQFWHIACTSELIGFVLFLLTISVCAVPYVFFNYALVLSVHAPALCLLKNASSPRHLDPSWHLRPLDTESMASTIRQTWRFSGQIVAHLSQFQNRTCLCQLFKWGGTKNSEGIPPPILYFPLMIGRTAWAMAKYEISLMTSKNIAWELSQSI